MEERYELAYVPSTWFAYFCGEKVRYCQPDALLAFPERRILLIVEVKYSHTVDAFWQLENLYLPVLRCYLGEANPWQLATVEIVKWFDPSIAFPCRVAMRERLEDVKVGEFAVHILNREDE